MGRADTKPTHVGVGAWVPGSLLAGRWVWVSSGELCILSQGAQEETGHALALVPLSHSRPTCH